MKNLVRLMGLLLLLSSCSKEVKSEKFIDAALQGVVLISDFDTYKDGKIVSTTLDDKESTDGAWPAKYFIRNALLFFDDGTCRHCYHPWETQSVEASRLYTTFYWELEDDSATLTLTSPELVSKGAEGAVGVLKIKRYRNGNFKFHGTLPTEHTPVLHNFYGRIGDAAERAHYEEKYKDETLFIDVE